MEKKIKVTIAFFLLSTIIYNFFGGINIYAEENTIDKKGFNTVKAVVTDVMFDNTKEKIEDKGVNPIRYQEIKIQIISGTHKGESYVLRNSIESVDVYNIIVAKGDKILVSLSEDESGKITNLHIFDLLRENYIYLFIAIFFILLILIGGMKGFKSIITLSITAFMVIAVLLPLILKGYNPILLSILVCGVVVVVSLALIIGINKKMATACLGTLGGVLIAGILALIAGYTCKITGLANEDAQMLAYLPQKMNLDFKGILFSGIIIGSLGAVMDVSISVSSAMHEIKEVKPSITNKELLKSGMNIGKDIMGSMSNTLILAYAGGSIQLMLLFMAARTSFHEIINLDMIASEIVRAIAGSIGLVCSIPITALAAIFINQYNKVSKKSK